MSYGGRRWTFGWPVVLAGGLLAAVPAHADVRIEKHLTLPPGGRLIVKTEVGSVVVRGGAASGAAVVVTSDRDDLEKDYELSFTATAGQAQVLVKRRDPSWFGGWHWRGKVEIAVNVPRATAASVHASGGRIEVSGLAGDTELSSSGGSVTAYDLAGKVDSRSSGGSVEVHDLRGDLHISSSGGSVHAAAVQGAIEAESSGGGVHLERVTGNVHAESSGGSVTVQEAAGRVTASSSGGPVTVRFTAGNAHGGDLDSSGGSVEVRVDPAVGLTVDASSSDGSVSCDLPLTVQGKISRHSLHGALHGGGELLHLRASGGGIRIAPL